MDKKITVLDNLKAFWKNLKDMFIPRSGGVVDGTLDLRGAPPLKVSSREMVENLNAEMVGGYNSDGLFKSVLVSGDEFDADTMTNDMTKYLMQSGTQTGKKFKNFPLESFGPSFLLCISSGYEFQIYCPFSNYDGEFLLFVRKKTWRVTYRDWSPWKKVVLSEISTLDLKPSEENKMNIDITKQNKEENGEDSNSTTTENIPSEPQDDVLHEGRG